MPGKPSQGYGEDLAYIHDVGFGGFSVAAAPGLIDLLRDNGITDGLVVDLGCGSGLWARALLRAGYDVFGVDRSASMITLSRRHAPAGTFRRGSYLDVPLPSCAAVTSLGECLNYLFDKRNSSRQLTGLFRRVYAALRSGSVFIFDMAVTGRAGAAGRRTLYRTGKDWAVMISEDEDRRANLLMRHLTTFRRVGKLYRRGEEVHRLSLGRPSALAADLRRVGFTVRYLRGYGERDFAKGHVGFLARKG